MLVTRSFPRVCMLIWLALLLTPALCRAEQTPLKQLSHKQVEQADSLSSLGLSNANKPNGRIYRFRESQPKDLPSHVKPKLGDQELSIADRTDDGIVCLYRGPFPEGYANCDYTALFYAQNGTVRWKLNLNEYLSAEEHLEIQDIRYQDGVLYFNEACLSYSDLAGGQCSSLVALDPGTPEKPETEVLWRTQGLVSNNIFILHDPWIISGYGFTNEPDFLYLVNAASGEIVSTTPLNTAHDYLIVKDGKLHVTCYGDYYVFELPE